MTLLKNRNILLVAIGMVLGVFLVGFAYEASAIIAKNLRSQVQTTRYRVSAADVIAAPITTDLTQRDVVLFTLQGGDQILSWVSKVNTPFTLPGTQGVNIQAIHAYRNGIDVSPACDVAFPPDLSVVNFEHRFGGCFEYAFYDEDLTTQIVVTFRSVDNTTDLSGITGGDVDFIVTKVQ